MTGAIETLLNGVWQSALLALAVAAALRRAGGLNAATRYWIWYAVLLAAAALSVHPVLPAPKAPAAKAAVALSEAKPERAAAAPGAIEAPVNLPIAPLAGWLCLMWAAAGATALARLARDYVRLGRLKRTAAASAAVNPECLAQWQDAAGGRRRPRLLDSVEIQLPAAAGLWRPAVLFPAGLKLSQAEAFQVWMHEASHFRRWDDWTNLVQKILEAIFCFHPVVRWAGRRLDLEREIACDDFVCASGGDPRPYAECLVRLASLRAPWPAAALGAASRRKQIFRRMEMILNRRRNTNPLPAPQAVLVALALVFGAAAAVSRVRPVVALASQAEAVAEVAPAPSTARWVVLHGAPRSAALPETPWPALPGAPLAAALPQTPPARAPEPPVAPEPPLPSLSGGEWVSRRMEEMTRRLERAGEEFRGRTAATLREIEERMEKLRAQVPDEKLVRDMERQMRQAEESLRWVEREFERQEREWERALRSVERDIGRLDREDESALPPPAPAAPPKPAPPAPASKPAPPRLAPGSSPALAPSVAPTPARARPAPAASPAPAVSPARSIEPTPAAPPAPPDAPRPATPSARPARQVPPPPPPAPLDDAI